MIKRIAGKTAVFLVLFLVAVASLCESAFDNISGGVLRLHVIANSDAEEDQRVKLCVRDALIELSKKDIGVWDMEHIENSKGQISDAVEKTLKEQGADYGFSLETGRFYFPKKTYENLTLPQGEYDALRVVLGDGAGQNWWCVMYPPLCFSKSVKGTLSEEEQKLLSERVGKAEYEIVSGESVCAVPAFRVLELWQELKKRVTQRENFK